MLAMTSSPPDVAIHHPRSRHPTLHRTHGRHGRRVRQRGDGPTTDGDALGKSGVEERRRRLDHQIQAELNIRRPCGARAAQCTHPHMCPDRAMCGSAEPAMPTIRAGTPWAPGDRRACRLRPMETGRSRTGSGPARDQLERAWAPYRELRAQSAKGTRRRSTARGCLLCCDSTPLRLPIGRVAPTRASSRREAAMAAMDLSRPCADADMSVQRA
ncbi:hypothetical protein C8Q77DRAFT_864268 [Trametes polyzona]|nr:hypothetical protein C8Q77DRAFT_864268 [Trametes polyzona]